MNSETPRPEHKGPALSCFKAERKYQEDDNVSFEMVDGMKQIIIPGLREADPDPMPEDDDF